MHSLRLLRELLRQKGYVFTDLSPSGNVPAMNERLGFRHLDVSTRLVVNRPSASRRVEVTALPAGSKRSSKGMTQVSTRTTVGLQRRATSW